ncbi:hypothetical protein MAPG_05474 [Magnaporthiopsis poae ATCC 64411]|uniref:Uncharacterized protein n=1 Tax=Magnaporthiopsis poae (strain ATCC 64411 / 73-15) TaxID=644358 RepID=A0A0C4DZH3_MAGP6|nr:hypothetical protein MAPG_05474 [Magnaporthiopsis poae ATCC 64411]
MSRSNLGSSLASPGRANFGEQSRVLVWELDTKRKRKANLKEDVLENKEATFDIGIGQRWVDVDLKGDSNRNEASTHVATVSIPCMVMIQRVFGKYKQMVVTKST